MDAHARRYDERMRKRLQQKGYRPRVAAYFIIGFWGVGVAVFGVVERIVDPSTFDNVWLAMWWAVQTVTTVGYGDVVPGGTAGKIIASLLMLGGLSLFAVVTGAITSSFVAQVQARQQADGEDMIVRKLEEVSAQLEAMKAEIARLDR